MTDLNIFYAAIAAANLHYATDLKTIEQAPPAERPAKAAAESMRHAREMATLGCSSVPPCPAETTGQGRCAVQTSHGAGLVPTGAVVDIGGTPWVAQTGYDGTPGKTPGLTLQSDSTVKVSVRSGERPWFDPPRKFRAEFCGLRRYPKAVPIRFHFAFRIDSSTDVVGLNWSSIAQIHQADLHYADGTFVEASPIFAINLKPGGAGSDVLEIGGGTATTALREPVLDPATGQQAIGPDGPRWRKHFPEERVLGQSAPLARDTWHDLSFSVTDAHGGLGQVVVQVDGASVLNLSSVPTGYSYADELANVAFAGGPQDTGSYIKFGVYAGLSSSETPPPTGSASVQYKDLHEIP